MDAFTITDRHLKDVWAVQVHGEVDAFSATQLREHVRAARAERVHRGDDRSAAPSAAPSDNRSDGTEGSADRSADRNAEGGAGGFVLDLTGVPFMDSAGLGACLGLLKRARAEGEQVAIAASASVVLRLLDLTHVPQVYPVHASLEEAVASLKG